MKVDIRTEVKPFITPNFVILENGKSVSIKELSPDSLDGLCREFRRNLFKKAGKEDDFD